MSSKTNTQLPKDLSYRQAMERLQRIVQDLQEGEVDIDALGDQVEEASALLRFCREKLRTTEARTEGLLDVDREEQAAS